MEEWFAVYNEAGDLVSVGTVVADPLPSGLQKKPLAGEPTGLVWDSQALAFVPPPPLDLTTIMIDTDQVLHALDPALRFTLWSSTDKRVQYFAYCLGAMNTVKASEIISSLDLVKSLGIIDEAKHAALIAALIPEG